jgi:tungstate transport system ATP-binding protein
MDVEIDDLRFERDGRVVLDVPSLHLRENRVTVMLGPNGAGKTTLLRLIAALEVPTRGHILAGGMRVRPNARMRQNVAYVFQEEVFLRQSVRANLELGLLLRRIDAAERRTRIEDAARLLGIAHLLDRRADRLSGGEARRASLARALCLRAPLVLLDEPLSGLDPASYSGLLDELHKLLHAFQSTTLMVTHDPQEAVRVGEDIVILIDGRVRAAGDKKDVVMNPAEPEVAQVLGYSILNGNGRRLAVPPRSLRLGAGRFEFQMVVEELLDLVDRREIVGMVGNVRVHVVDSPASPAPERGEQVTIHADRVCDLS